VSNSFLSGHVRFYTFFGFLSFLTRTQLPHSFCRVVALALTGSLIVLIGPSRMYLGAHWLSNVIIAHLLGFIIVAFGIETYLRCPAPCKPPQQGGPIGRHDQVLQSPK
jgi:undecaprenyl-diphosphatase